jgi:hypothetical protein
VNKMFFPKIARILIWIFPMLPLSFIAGCKPSDGYVTVPVVDNIELVKDETLEYINMVKNSEVILPDFLSLVWPPPESELSECVYVANINSTAYGGTGVRLHANVVHQYFMGAQFGYEIFSEEDKVLPQNQAFLFIDGQVVDGDLLKVYAIDQITIRDNESGFVIYDDIGQMDLSWNVPLMPGKYEAKFLIVSKDGDNALEYIWTFTIR